MSAPDPRPFAEKRALRSHLLALRSRLTPDERADRSRLVVARVDALPLFRAARVVALYAPLGAEVDVLPLASLAAARGARVAFPRVVPAARRLAFATCEPGDLVRGSLGAGEPPAAASPVALPDIECVVMPGVAFSEDGLRLGRGGGYYDATLAAMPGAARIGVAFDTQIVAALPREAHDMRMDAVASEARTLVFPRESR